MECVVCQSTGETKICSGCTRVSYCSVEHQKEDWRTHKSICSPFKVVDSGDPEKGKYCIASRNFSTGEVILVERAAIFSPWTARFATCLPCGANFGLDPMGLISTCSICGCNVCGPACEQIPVHANNECQLIAKNKRILALFESIPEHTSVLLAMIRGAALKRRQPKVFSELFQLQRISSSRSFEEYKNTVVHRCLVALKLVMSPRLLEFDDEDYLRMGEIILVNGFRQANVDPKRAIALAHGKNKQGLHCLYVKASRFNHSCSPNCAWIIGPQPECKMRIIAAVPILKGEELTVDYPGSQADLITFGTHDRRELLRNDCGVNDCKCRRCSDPTEMGSYSSGITCTTCKMRLDAKGESDCTRYGYLLAENPLDDSPKALWKCTICGKKQINSTILPMVRNIYLEFKSKFYFGTVFPLTSDSKDLVQQFELTMKKYRGNILHPNHFLIVKAANSVRDALKAEGCIGRLPDFSALELQRKRIMFLIDIYAMIYPGLSKARAVFCQDLFHLLNMKIRRFAPILSVAELADDFKLLVTSGLEAVQLYKHVCYLPREPIDPEATRILCITEELKIMWGDMLQFGVEEVKAVFKNLIKGESNEKIRFLGTRFPNIIDPNRYLELSAQVQ